MAIYLKRFREPKTQCPPIAENNRKHLFSRFDLIVRHKQYILNRPENYFIFIEGVTVADFYSKELPLALGDLITLWETSPEWAFVKDGAQYYGARMMGSCLSGTSYFALFNYTEKVMFHIKDSNFRKRYDAAENVIRAHRPAEKRRLGDKIVFSSPKTFDELLSELIALET